MRDLIDKIDSPDGAFHDGNPASGETGTIVSAKWLNAIQDAAQSLQSEVLSVLAANGIASDPGKTDQLFKAFCLMLNKKADVTGIESAFPVGPAEHGGDAVQLRQLQAAIASIQTTTSFRNLLVNGAQRVAQQFGDAAISPVANSTYVTDQWQISGSQSGKVNFQRVAGPRQFGFEYYAQITAPAAIALGASDFFTFYQNVESSMLAPLLWGYANALPVSLQFVVNMPVAGVYSGALINTDGTRSFPFRFSVQKAGTDTLITIPGIPGDIAGTWVAAGNGIGLKVAFNLGAGSAVRAPAGAWAQGLFWAAAEQTVDLVATAGAAYKITGVQFEVGSVCTTYERPTPEAELARCQRYLPGLVLSTAGAQVVSIGRGYSSTLSEYVIPFPVQPRVAPTGLYVSNPANFKIDNAGLNGVVQSIAYSVFTGVNAGYVVVTTAQNAPSISAGVGLILYTIAGVGGKLLFTGAQL